MQGAMNMGAQHFESVEQSTPIERVIMGFAGALCLLPLWDFFGRQRIDPFQIFLLPFWFIAIAATGMALVFLGGAIVGGTRTVTIDAAARQVIIRDSAWLRQRVTVHAFSRTIGRMVPGNSTLL